MDPDAIGSIVGLSQLIEEMVPANRAIKVFPSAISKVSRKLLASLGLELEFVDDLSSDGMLPVLLDIQQLRGSTGDSEATWQPFSVIIDHHQEKPDLVCALKFLDANVQSNCEIVYKFYKSLGITPHEPSASALLAGLLADSGFLRYGENSTIAAAFELLQTGIEVGSVRRMITERMDMPERMARLKAGNRVTIAKVGDILIASSEVSSFEASACRGLIGLGADVAVVLSETKHEVRISARQNDDVRAEFGVNLAEIMQSVGDTIGGSGGGHVVAAAANGTVNGKEGLAQAAELVERVIKEKLAGVEQASG